MILTQQNLQRIKDAATERFKAGHNSNYEPELQVALSVIEAFVEAYARATGNILPLELVVRKPYQPVDTLD